MKLLTVKILICDDETEDEEIMETALDNNEYHILDWEILEEDFISNDDLEMLAVEWNGHDEIWLHSMLESMYYNKSLIIIDRAVQYILNWED